MKNLKASFIILVCFVFCSCSTQENKPENPAIAIASITVIDAVHGLRQNQTVVIKGNRIEYVVPAPEYEAQKYDRVVDGSGKYLIPGLWDAHVHLSFDPDLTPAMFKLFLVNGITAIRDTGGMIDQVIPQKEKSAAEPSKAPRVFVAGPLLDGVPTVYTGVSPQWPKLGLGAATPREAEKLVDEFVEAGVDFIKSYEMLTPEAFKAVIEKSKSYGKMVTGHVPLSMDVTEASDLGLRSMEHLRNLEMSTSGAHDSLLQVRLTLLDEGKNEEGGDLRSRIHAAQRDFAIQTADENRRDLVLNKLAKNGTWQIPTLTIVTVGSRRPFTRKQWRENFKYLPDSVEVRWNTLSAEFANTPVSAESENFTAWALEMISHLSEAGVVIMAGTDTPIAFLTPGFSLHEELSLLVEGGLTPMQALEAATLRPAQYFGLENELGSIEAGKFADLVLLNANPLEDIANTRQIESVIREGYLYDRAALDTILAELQY